MRPTKAIIAVAGYGTRRLPISKSVEKCMMPLLNRPVIDYVVQDCIGAGITDIYFVVSKGAQQLQSYYERDEALEGYLRVHGKQDMLAMITPPDNVTFHYIEQDRDNPLYGTSVPVWVAKDYISPDESFVVIMGDQCLYSPDSHSELAALLDDMGQAGVDAGMIGVDVPKEDVVNYGIIDLDEQGRYRRIVDKPSVEEAPSTLNNACIYVFPGQFMQYIEQNIEQTGHGEYMITDAINAYVQEGGAIQVRTSRAAYLDCGTVAGWVAANNYLYELQTRK